MVYLFGKILLFLIIGLIAGFVIGWKFFDTTRSEALKSRNIELRASSREVKAQLQQCEESIRPEVSE